MIRDFAEGCGMRTDQASVEITSLSSARSLEVRYRQLQTLKHDPKSGDRFFEKIMLKQKDKSMLRVHPIATCCEQDGLTIRGGYLKGNGRWPNIKLTSFGSKVACWMDRIGIPRQQRPNGSLPLVPRKVGAIHGAPERRWQRRRFPFCT